METIKSQKENTTEKTSGYSRIANKVGEIIEKEWESVLHGEQQAEEWMLKRFGDMKISFAHTLDLLDLEIKDWKEDARGELHEIRKKLDFMRSLLKVAAAETLVSMENQKKQILDAWMDLRKRIEARPEYAHFRDSLKDEWMDWKIRFDLLKVRAHLAGMDAEDAVVQFRKKYAKERDAIVHTIEEGAGIVQEKISAFEDELKKILDRIRND
jgi:hypothetical protein